MVKGYIPHFYSIFRHDDLSSHGPCYISCHVKKTTITGYCYWILTCNSKLLLNVQILNFHGKIQKRWGWHEFSYIVPWLEESCTLLLPCKSDAVCSCWWISSASISSSLCFKLLKHSSAIAILWSSTFVLNRKTYQNHRTEIKEHQESRYRLHDLHHHQHFYS